MSLHEKMQTQTEKTYSLFKEGVWLYKHKQRRYTMPCSRSVVKQTQTQTEKIHSLFKECGYTSIAAHPVTLAASSDPAPANPMHPHIHYKYKFKYTYITNTNTLETQVQKHNKYKCPHTDGFPTLCFHQSNAETNLIVKNSQTHKMAIQI